jgi:hypothetical protein
MPSAEPSSGLKALRYAEDQLKVHGIYDEAVAARGRLDSVLTDLSERRDKRRAVEEDLRTREWEVATEEWGKHPDFSATKMDQHLKQARYIDPICMDLRASVTDLTSDIEGLEYDKTMLETDIKIAVARLQELGGFLNYLAAIKQAETANNT